MIDIKYKLLFVFVYIYILEMFKILIVINCLRFGLRVIMCILDELRGICVFLIMVSELFIIFINAVNNGL